MPGTCRGGLCRGREVCRVPVCRGVLNTPH
nr:MAG TPA: hypothetical protein [Caudoviricetes sp.]